MEELLLQRSYILDLMILKRGCSTNAQQAVSGIYSGLFCGATRRQTLRNQVSVLFQPPGAIIRREVLAFLLEIDGSKDDGCDR
jgi:hypothetical protein